MNFDWPKDLDWRPVAGRFALTPISHHSMSPYTGSSKVINLTQIWRTEWQFNANTLASRFNIQGFIDGLEGGANTVKMFDPWRTKPKLQGTFTWSDGTIFDDGTGWLDAWAVVVLTAGSVGDKTFAVSGLPVSQACFSRGDLIEINGSVYEIRYDASSNSSGQALLSILPGLRAACAVSDPVNVYFPAVQMRLENYAGQMTRSFNWHEGFSLTFVEDIQ